MSRENCNECAYKCSCCGLRKAQTAALGYCFDYEKEDSWTNHIDLILTLACAVVMLGIGLAAVLHLSLWLLEAVV